MDESIMGNVVGSLIDKNRDDWGNGGFVWIILLFFLFGFGGNGFGNRGNCATVQDVATNGMYNQINGDQRMMERNQFNTNETLLTQFGNSNLSMQGGFANLAQATQGGFANVAQAIAENRYAQQSCCCETNRNIDAVRYQMAQDTCAVTTTDTANTQKILDAICQLKSEAKDNEIMRLRTDLQAAQLTLSNANQTSNIIGAIRPYPVPAYPVSSPYVGLYGTTIA